MGQPGDINETLAAFTGAVVAQGFESLTGFTAAEAFNPKWMHDSIIVPGLDMVVTAAGPHSSGSKYTFRLHAHTLTADSVLADLVAIDGEAEHPQPYRLTPSPQGTVHAVPHWKE